MVLISSLNRLQVFQICPKISGVFSLWICSTFEFVFWSFPITVKSTLTCDTWLRRSRHLETPGSCVSNWMENARAVHVGKQVSTNKSFCFLINCFVFYCERRFEGLLLLSVLLMASAWFRLFQYLMLSSCHVLSFPPSRPQLVLQLLHAANSLQNICF